MTTPSPDLDVTRRFEGAFTALITPFTPAGDRLDDARFEANIRAQAVAGVQGIVPCGTTGETPTLRRAEYEAVVTRAIQVGHESGLVVIPGAGSYDTRTAIELHRFAADAGADAALHVTPYYNRPSQAGVREHFESIADAADLPIVLYDIPGRTGTKIAFETIAALAKHPNVVAVKDATGSLETAQRVVTETDLVLLSGDDPMTLPMMALGGRGVVSVLSNLYPGRVARLVRDMLDGRLEPARHLHRELLPLARVLLSIGPNPVPLKAALHLLGRDTGIVRAPLVQLDDEARAVVADHVSATELHGATVPVTS